MAANLNLATQLLDLSNTKVFNQNGQEMEVKYSVCVVVQKRDSSLDAQHPFNQNAFHVVVRDSGSPHITGHEGAAETAETHDSRPTAGERDRAGAAAAEGEAASPHGEAPPVSSDPGAASSSIPSDSELSEVAERNEQTRVHHSGTIQRPMGILTPSTPAPRIAGKVLCIPLCCVGEEQDPMPWSESDRMLRFGGKIPDIYHYLAKHAYTGSDTEPLPMSGIVRQMSSRFFKDYQGYGLFYILNKKLQNIGTISDDSNSEDEFSLDEFPDLEGGAKPDPAFKRIVQNLSGRVVMLWVSNYAWTSSKDMANLCPAKYHKENRFWARGYFNIEFFLQPQDCLRSHVIGVVVGCDGMLLHKGERPPASLDPLGDLYREGIINGFAAQVFDKVTGRANSLVGASPPWHLYNYIKQQQADMMKVRMTKKRGREA